jgi:hypothetical protein
MVIDICAVWVDVETHFEIERPCTVTSKKSSPKPIDAKTVYKAVDIIRAQSHFGHKISRMLVDIADIVVHTKRYQTPNRKRDRRPDRAKDSQLGR